MVDIPPPSRAHIKRDQNLHEVESSSNSAATIVVHPGPESRSSNQNAQVQEARTPKLSYFNQWADGPGSEMDSE